MWPVALALGAVSTGAGVYGGLTARKAAKKQARIERAAAARKNKFHLGELEQDRLDTEHKFSDLLRNQNEEMGERFEGEGTTGTPETEARKELEYQKQRRLDAIGRQKDYIMANFTDSNAIYDIQRDAKETVDLMNQIQALINGGASGYAAYLQGS